jgi:hypothetical protein
VVRDIRRATRKHHSAEDKIRIVLEGLRGEPTGSASGVERQRRYRASKDLCSIDISRPTLLRLEALRVQAGLSVDQTIARALDLLAAELAALEPSKGRRRSGARAAKAGGPAGTASSGGNPPPELSPGDATAVAPPDQSDLFGTAPPPPANRRRKP